MRQATKRLLIYCALCLLFIGWIFYKFTPPTDIDAPEALSASLCQKCRHLYPPCKCTHPPPVRERVVSRGRFRSREKVPSTFGRPGWTLDCITWERKWEAAILPDTGLRLFRSHTATPTESLSHRLDTFQEIFRRRDWPAQDAGYGGLQASGPGAMLRNAQGVIATLHAVVSRLRAHLGRRRLRLLDVPCGDMQWMASFLGTRDDVEYTGADIVPELISQHRQTYSRLPRTRFAVLDLAAETVNGTYDVILVRDLLQHLWLADAQRVLENVSRGQQGYLLVTSFPGSTENKEVERRALGGRKSSYNLELPPFSLEPPVCSAYDWNVEHLGLWKLPLRQKFP